MTENMTPSNDPRTWTDEDLDETIRHLSRTGYGFGETADRINAELARRAEIRMNRYAAAAHGPNPYGFTTDDVVAMHDASWYASRQTRDQFHAEMGYDVHASECEGSHVADCPIGRAERDEANRRAAGAQAKWDAANGRPPRRNGYGFGA